MFNRRIARYYFTISLLALNNGSYNSLLQTVNGGFMLKQHFVLWRETNAGPEEIFHGRALLAKRINDRSTRRYERCLEHEAENRENRMKRSKFRHLFSAILNAGHEFGNYSEVKDKRRRKKRIFASVVERNSL